MAPDKTVDIGSFSIASKVDTDFALTVSSSMSLSLPEHFADHPTAVDLRDQVKAGALWLTRAGSCRLILEIHFEHPAGMSVHGDAQRRQIAIEAFQSFPVWCELGLELRLELNVLQSKRTPSTTSIYYIHHTQQHSGLFVPQHVPCGYLSEFFCSFRYAARTFSTPGNAEQSVPRSRDHTRYNLRKLAETPSEPRPVCAAAFWGLPLDVQAARVVHLTHNALNFVLGMRRRCVGVRCLKRTKPPALLELAPALWNAQYFQNVVTRARLIPAISSALGNLTSTQSLVLRRKIVSLVPDSAADSGLDNLLDELHRRTQVLLLRASRDQKIKSPLQRAEAQSVHAPGPVLSQEGSSVPKAWTTNALTDHAGLDLVNKTLHLQEDGQSHEITSGLPAHGLTHLESGSSYGLTMFGAGSTRSDVVNFASQEDYMNDGMEDAGWIEDDMVSYTSEDLLEYGGPYNEHGMGDEVLDPTSSEHEYQEPHLALDFHQEHSMVNAEYYDESDLYSTYHEVPDIEGGVRARARACENYSAEPSRASGTFEDPGADFSDLTASEDDIMSDDIYEHLVDDVPDFDEGHSDPRDIPYDYDQGNMLCWGGIDTEAGPNYMTGGHAHDDQAEAGECNTWVGSHRQGLQDWGVVRRSYAYHDTEERRVTSWAAPGRLH